MKRTVILLLLAGLTLASCSSSQETRLAGSTWQITDIYRSQGEPSELPSAVRGLAQLYFGESTLTGYSGCTPLQGEISFSPSDPEQASEIIFNQLEADTPQNCSGEQLLVHNELLDLLHGTFEITRPSDYEVVLTQAGAGIDRPSLRLATG